jgi:hypothetical protein
MKKILRSRIHPVNWWRNHNRFPKFRGLYNPESEQRPNHRAKRCYTPSPETYPIFNGAICQLMLCINTHSTFNTVCAVMSTSSRNTLSLLWHVSNPANHPSSSKSCSSVVEECLEKDTFTEITRQTRVALLHAEIKTPDPSIWSPRIQWNLLNSLQSKLVVNRCHFIRKRPVHPNETAQDRPPPPPKKEKRRRNSLYIKSEILNKMWQNYNTADTYALLLFTKT